LTVYEGAPAAGGAAELARTVSPSLPADIDAPNITTILVSLVKTLEASGFAEEVFVDRVIETLFPEDHESKATERDLIHDALKVRSVGLTVKAIDLLNEYERRLLEARVVTDLRPVFENEDLEASCALIVHNLRLEVETNLLPEAFFVALTDEQMRDLSKVLERALMKSDALRARGASSGFTILDGSED